jgi:hypothetical protein
MMNSISSDVIESATCLSEFDVLPALSTVDQRLPAFEPFGLARVAGQQLGKNESRRAFIFSRLQRRADTTKLGIALCVCVVTTYK